MRLFYFELLGWSGRIQGHFFHKPGLRLTIVNVSWPSYDIIVNFSPVE